MHLAEPLQPVRLLVDKGLQRVAETVPGGNQVPRLSPSEHPRNGPQILQTAGLFPAAGARTDFEVIDQVDRGRLAEIIEKARRLGDQVAVEFARVGGESPHRRLPAGQFAGRIFIRRREAFGRNDR